MTRAPVAVVVLAVAFVRDVIPEAESVPEILVFPAPRVPEVLKLPAVS